MYNKLFTKILDSSIWLETTPTRIVWLTFIAVMDEKGFAPFAAVGNVANRARVTIEEARAAIEVLEAPDIESSDPENEGRRLERVPGGWIVLNAEKHRDLVTRAIKQAQTAERVRRHREKKRKSNAAVTPSEAVTEAVTEARSETQTIPNLKNKLDIGVVASVKAANGNGTNARSKHPIFKGQRIVVFDWMLEDVTRMLGPHAEAFFLDEWWYTLDQQAISQNVVIPPRDKGAFVLQSTLAEAIRRGLPVADGSAVKLTDAQELAMIKSEIERHAERVK